MISPTRIAEITALAEAASEGPWRFTPWHIEEGPSAVRAPGGWLICSTADDASAAFIAAARTAVPELLAENAELRARVAVLRRAIIGAESPLLAIAEPGNLTAPDAEVCRGLARIALARIGDARAALKEQS